MDNIADYINEQINNSTLTNILISNHFITGDDIRWMVGKIETSKLMITINECTVDITCILKNNINLEKVKIVNSTIYNPLKRNQGLFKEFSNENLIVEKSYTLHTIENSNNDLTKLSEKAISKLHLKNLDLRHVRLPEARELFQLIRGKTVKKTKLPDINLTNYNTKDVSFVDCKFTDKSILPSNFFRELKNRKITGCTLPPIHLTKSNIEDCIFEFIVFNKNTTFENNKTLFNSANSIFNCHLPNYDYRKYDFEKTNITYCTFGSKSKLPLKETLSEKIISNHYPKKWIAKNIAYISTGSIDVEELIIKYYSILTTEQIYLLACTVTEVEKIV